MTKCKEWLIHLNNGTISVPRAEFYAALKHLKVANLVVPFQEAEKVHGQVFMSVPSLCHEDYTLQMYRAGRGLDDGNLAPRPFFEPRVIKPRRT